VAPNCELQPGKIFFFFLGKKKTETKDSFNSKIAFCNAICFGMERWWKNRPGPVQHTWRWGEACARAFLADQGVWPSSRREALSFEHK